MAASVEHKVTFCRICEPFCGMIATVEDGTLIALRPDKDHPLSSGFACQKGIAFTEVVNDPDRVTVPLRRMGDGFEPVSWDEALADITTRLSTVLRDHGSGSVGWYFGNPGAFSYAHVLSALGFIKGLGRRTHFFTASSQDTNSRLMASQLLYGTPISVPIPDLTRTELLVVMGANPVVSHGSFLTAPRIRDRMHDIVKGGGRVVVIDPRRSETAAQFEWCGIIPDTDSHLLLSLLQVMFDEGLVDVGQIAAHADGLDWLRTQAAPFTPEVAQAFTGIDADVVRALARDLAATPRAAIYGRLGTRGTVRDADLLPDRRRQPGRRKSRQTGRIGLRQPGDTGAAVGQHHDGGLPAPRLPPKTIPDRRVPRADRLRAGRTDGHGDTHPGSAADQSVVHQRRQSGAVGAQRK